MSDLHTLVTSAIVHKIVFDRVRSDRYVCVLFLHYQYSVLSQ